MFNLTSALGVLSAMITPAVLISACGSLILATSARLMRVVDRVREISNEFELLASEAPTERSEMKRSMIFEQLDRATSRARLLQRAMTRLYLALSAFVATSIAIGLLAVTASGFAWIALLFGFIGAGLLLWASVILIFESRIGLAATYAEMDYIWKQGQHHAPARTKR